MERKPLMARLLGYLLVLALIIAIVGFYRGWFTVSQSTGETGTEIQIHIDKQKVEQDKEAAKKKIENIEQGLKTSTEKTGTTATGPAPR
jgi:hypothetical protein